WGLGRAWGWGAGGRGRNIILGLPAVLAMGFALFVTLRVLAYPVTDLLKFYQAASEQALQDKNFQAARIAHERLCLLRGDLPEYRYGLAMAAIGLGELERARGLMSTIAPVRGPLGYGPAHLWMAQDLLTRQPATPQSLLTAEVQLHRAIKAQPDLVDARALLGMIYMN